MRAIVLEKFGGLDSLVYKDIPEPEPKAGHVVIEIKALGINHAEMHMRRARDRRTSFTANLPRHVSQAAAPAAARPRMSRLIR